MSEINPEDLVLRNGIAVQLGPQVANPGFNGESDRGERWLKVECDCVTLLL